MTFYECSSLTSIELPNSLTSIGDGAFSNTPLINNKDNYINGVLYIGKYLIATENNIESLIVQENSVIASSAFNGCYRLRYLSIYDLSYGQLSSLTNLETLIINNVNYDMPLLYEAFGYSIPQTFKNIVLKDCGYKINKNMFYNITGINIFIDEYKENLMWNEDTPNWNNGNKVYYKGDWTKVEFFDENNTWIDTQYRTISEIIKQPHVSSKIDNEYSTIFIGWDIDGDGIVDSIPATSTTDIIAKAIKQTLKT